MKDTDLELFMTRLLVWKSTKVNARVSLRVDKVKILLVIVVEGR